MQSDEESESSVDIVSVTTKKVVYKNVTCWIRVTEYCDWLCEVVVVRSKPMQTAVTTCDRKSVAKEAKKLLKRSVR